MSVRRERRISSRFICHDMFWVRDKSFYKNLIVLAVPIILQNVISFGVSLADNIMIGQLGEVPIAALHIGTKVQGVLQIILFGVESALIILSSQYWGKRDTDHIKDVISIALRLTFVVTAPMAFIAFFLPEWFVGLITDHPDIIRCCAAYLRILAVSYLVFGIKVEVADGGVTGDGVALVVLAFKQVGEVLEAPFHFFHGFVAFRNGAGENFAGNAAKTFLQTFEEVVRDEVAIAVFVFGAGQDEDLLVREVGGDVLAELLSANFLIADFLVDGTGVAAVQRHGPDTHGDGDSLPDRR